MEKHSVQPDASHLPQIRPGLTKKEIVSLAEGFVEQVLEEGSVTHVAETLAAMEAFVKCIRKDERFVQFLREEIDKHQGKLTMASGAKIENCEAGVQYDYASNAEWRMLENEIAELTERKKMLEERLRKILPGKMAVDPETGEVLEGAMKVSRSTYRVTLSR